MILWDIIVNSFNAFLDLVSLKITHTLTLIRVKNGEQWGGQTLHQLLLTAMSMHINSNL